MWIILAIPMAFRMAAWAAHGTRRIRTPPGFGIWLLFLVAAGAGIMVLSLTAPGTVVSPVSHRILSYADRIADLRRPDRAAAVRRATSPRPSCPGAAWPGCSA